MSIPPSPTSWRSAVASSIARSPEALDRVVNQIYLKFLGRPADPGGLANFVGLLQKGYSEEFVIGSVLGVARIPE